MVSEAQAASFVCSVIHNTVSTHSLKWLLQYLPSHVHPSRWEREKEEKKATLFVLSDLKVVILLLFTPHWPELSDIPMSSCRESGS